MKRLWTISVIIVLTALCITACGNDPQAVISRGQRDMIYTCGFEMYADFYMRKLDIEVVHSQMPAGGEEELLQELLSGNCDVDIFVVWGSKCWEDHVFTDLSVSETLADCVEQMHGVLKVSAYQGEELAGIPVRVMGEVMAYNQASEGYPLVKERIADWDDLLAFTDEVSPQYTVMANKAGLYQLLLTQYIWGYGDPLGGNVDFDTEAFRKVLDLMKQIHDNPHFQEPGTGGMMSYGSDYDFRATDLIGINRLVVTDYIGDPRGLPDIEPDNVLAPRIRVAYAVVNPNSERKEAAIRYLEMMVTGNAYSETAEIFPLPGNDNLNAFMEDATVYYEQDLYGAGRVSADIDSWLQGQTGLEETVAAIQEKSGLFFGK